MLNQKEKISVFLIIFFLISIYAFILSDSGILMRNQLNEKKYEIIKNIQILEEKNKELIKNNNEIANGKINKKDFLNSGYISYGDTVLFLKGKEPKIKKNKSEKTEVDEFGIHLKHMRMFWLVLSLLILLVYFSLILRKNKDLALEE